MIPEVSVPQIDAKADGRVLLDPLHDDELRDVPLLRAQSAKLVNEVGELLRRHAAEMGAASGYTCAFQVDRFGQLLIWQLCEFLTQSGCDQNFMDDSIHYLQVDEHHIADFFDWPPASESEA